MLFAWTTVATREDANRIAREVIQRRLAACVQVDGPITSHYIWDGKVEQSQEYRLCCKCLPVQLDMLERYILSAHPYETPEWVVIRADRVAEKYLSWATSNSSSAPL